MSPTDEPSWIKSYKFLFFGSWANVLLVFVPLSFVSHYCDLDAVWRFSFSFLAIMPLAKLLGVATDQLSLKLGQTLSGLLNASFGNAVEIIVGVVALLNDELRIVQTAMLGSILSNLLLVLGCSFFAGGLKFKESNFRVTAAQNASSLMMLACLTLVIPAAYSMSQKFGNNPDGFDPSRVFAALNDPKNGQMLSGVDLQHRDGLLIISRGTAIILLFVYVAYLVFQLRTHAYLFKAEECQEEQEISEMNVPAAGSALVFATVFVSFCADFLVASIEETANTYNIPKPFIGLILLPFASNAAEQVTSVWMATKNKMEITIGICMGSSIQAATFVIPLLVIMGWITQHELTLYFANFETIILFVSVMMVNLLIQDGKSNYMEGLMLVTLYLVVALAFWVS